MPSRHLPAPDVNGTRALRATLTAPEADRLRFPSLFHLAVGHFPRAGRRNECHGGLKVHSQAMQADSFAMSLAQLSSISLEPTPLPLPDGSSIQFLSPAAATANTQTIQPPAATPQNKPRHVKQLLEVTCDCGTANSCGLFCCASFEMDCSYGSVLGGRPCWCYHTFRCTDQCGNVTCVCAP